MFIMEQYYLASGYSNSSKEDMTVFRVNESGEMDIVSTYRQGDAPSFLCRRKERIYAVSECSEYAAVTSYVIQRKKLIPEKRMEVAGAGLCHLYAGERALFASCYLSGDIYVLDDRLTGILYHYSRQNGQTEKISHMHWSIIPDGKNLLAADCGRDQIDVFPLKKGIPDGRVYAIPLEKGSGPRQVLFDRRWKSTVIVGEHNSSLYYIKSSLRDEMPCREDFRKSVKRIPATDKKSQKNYPGGACVNFQGKLFLANRGENTIAVFDLQKDCNYQGEWDCEGIWPRHLCITEKNILFAACEKSNQVNSFLWRDGQLYFADSIPLYGAACVISL